MDGPVDPSQYIGHPDAQKTPWQKAVQVFSFAATNTFTLLNIVADQNYATLQAAANAIQNASAAAGAYATSSRVLMWQFAQ